MKPVSKEQKMQNNCDRQKRYRESHDKISTFFEKGTLERIQALGFTGNAFIKEATMEKLERLEKENCK